MEFVIVIIIVFIILVVTGGNSTSGQTHSINKNNPIIPHMCRKQIRRYFRRR